MTAIKHFFIIPCLLLTACAPPRAALDMPTTLTAPSDAELLAANTPTGKEKTAAELKTEKGLLPATAEATKELTKTTALNKKGESVNNPSLKVAGPANAITSWEISGAMAARNKSKGWSASINWIQRGSGSYQIRLYGPLGGGTVIINKQGGVVTLRDGAKTASSGNADDLLMKQTGVRLPVANLYYWVRGLPAPGSVQAAKRDSANRLVLLRQGGYTIEYNQYTSVGQVVLPTNIRLQGNGVFLKLVIKRWRV